MTKMKWKNLMVIGLMVFVVADLASLVKDVIIPSQASMTAVQQATDTMDAQVATRAMNESLAMLSFGIDVARFVGVVIVFIGLLMLIKQLGENGIPVRIQADKNSSPIQGGETNADESKTDVQSKNK